MGAPNATHDQSVGLLAGACLGGGTVVNYTTSFRTPDDVRAEWAAHGVPAFASDEYTASLDAVCERLGVNQEYNEPSTREQKLQRGLRRRSGGTSTRCRAVCASARRARSAATAGSAAGSAPSSRSSRRGWPTPHGAGTRLIVRTKVERVVVEGGAARGIVGRRSTAIALTVRSRAVIAACGAIHTPALLKRSGLAEPEHRQAPQAPPRDRGVGRRSTRS